MEIIKNNKKYFYSIPTFKDVDYSYLTNILSDLDIERCRINIKFCWIFSKKKILTKLKYKFNKKEINYYGIDNYDNSYIYRVSLITKEDFDKINN